MSFFILLFKLLLTGDFLILAVSHSQFGEGIFFSQHFLMIKAKTDVTP